jgi:hypothetical protein
MGMVMKIEKKQRSPCLEPNGGYVHEILCAGRCPVVSLVHMGFLVRETLTKYSKFRWHIALMYVLVDLLM